MLGSNIAASVNAAQNFIFNLKNTDVDVEKLVQHVLWVLGFISCPSLPPIWSKTFYLLIFIILCAIK